MREILTILRAVLSMAKSIHNPLHHSYIYEEKECGKCRFHKKLERVIKQGESL